MSHTTLDPSTVGVLGVPNYTHGIASKQASRWLHLSGQVGLRPDGSFAESPLDQCRQALANIGALLEADGMAIPDIVHMRIYLVDRGYLAALCQARC